VKNGKGKEIGENEDYEGSFKNDKRDGKGKLYFKKGKNTYTGDFKEGNMNGMFEIYWNNGDSYVGFVVNGIFEGKGRYKWIEGMEYNGFYEKGIRQGYGEYTYQDGSQFKGEFINNKPHGKGILNQLGNENEVYFDHGNQILNKDNKTKKVEKEERKFNY